MGVCWVIMKRENEELIIHEMHAKDWKLNASKILEAVILLDLITMLRAKSQIKHQGKVDVCMDDREMWIITNTSTIVENRFNQDSAAEINSIKKLMKEADLDITLIR